MFHRFDELNGGEPLLVRSLDLAHAPSDTGEVTYLGSATQCGYAPLPGGGYSKRSLPALEFELPGSPPGVRPCGRRTRVGGLAAGWCVEPEPVGRPLR